MAPYDEPAEKAGHKEEIPAARMPDQHLRQETDRHGYGRQGYITGQTHHDNKDKKTGQSHPPVEGQHDCAGGCHAFSPFEMQEKSVIMTQYNGKPGHQNNQTLYRLLCQNRHIRTEDMFDRNWDNTCLAVSDIFVSQLECRPDDAAALVMKKATDDYLSL